MLAVTADDAQIFFALGIGLRLIEHQIGIPYDRCHRRADFMAHVGQELALGLAGRLGGAAGGVERDRCLFQFLCLMLEAFLGIEKIGGVSLQTGLGVFPFRHVLGQK